MSRNPAETQRSERGPNWSRVALFSTLIIGVFAAGPACNCDGCDDEPLLPPPAGEQMLASEPSQRCCCSARCCCGSPPPPALPLIKLSEVLSLAICLSSADTAGNWITLHLKI